MKKMGLLMVLVILVLANSAGAYTYVGSYRVSDGDYWGTNPDVYSAREAAVFLFGGSVADYAISIDSSLDEASITFTGWYIGWGQPWTAWEQDFKQDADPAGYQYPAYDAWSAYVYDHYDFTKVNYVWLVDADNVIPEPSMLFMLGFGLLGLFGVGRKKFR